MPRGIFKYLFSQDHYIFNYLIALIPYYSDWFPKTWKHLIPFFINLQCEKCKPKCKTEENKWSEWWEWNSCTWDGSCWIWSVLTTSSDSTSYERNDFLKVHSRKECEALILIRWGWKKSRIEVLSDFSRERSQYVTFSAHGMINFFFFQVFRGDLFDS